MARVTVEDCLNRVNSRFALVHLAVRRVMQARKGYPVFVEAPKNKEIVRALREIAGGEVTLDNIRELEAGPGYLEEKAIQAEAGEVVASEVQTKEPELPEQLEPPVETDVAGEKPEPA